MSENVIDICKELSQNAIDFAYEANSQRAFADARDGLKPGQRACLWEMYKKGYSSNKPHVKSAKVSGGVIATWWPHGDVAVYETFARMSMPWINNIPEVDWHGANGNQIIGNAPASSRYTEARLSKAAEDGMLQGIKKNNVPMITNFSEDEEWPEVFPAIFPRLLVNGCQGIGYTIANVWLPCSLKETTDAIINYINTGRIDNNSVKPDFPSGGIIINGQELYKINETGKGKVILRAKTEIKNNSIFITELPYQIYVEPLIDEIKKLIINDEIVGIKDILNKSDKKRLLIEIECESGKATNILNKLFTLTDLQKTYNANQYALVGKVPKLLNLKDYFDIYISHNTECIKKEYEFDLNKAKNRSEIVEGLLKALEDIDNIIALIKKSNNSSGAQINLIKKYSFTENQAKAIVDMKLGRLAHLESVELNEEKIQLINTISNINNILSNSKELEKVLIDRLISFTNKYGKDRHTEITTISNDNATEENSPAVIEKVVVTISQNGNIKRISANNFKVQKRGGKGPKNKEEIALTSLSINTNEYLLIFTSKGKMYKIFVNDIPEDQKGIMIQNLIALEDDEKIMAVTKQEKSKKYVVFITKNGYLKKTAFEEYSNLKRNSGIIAIKLNPNDTITNVLFMDDEEIMLVTKNGNGIRFETRDINPIGRNTLGIIAIKLEDGDEVISAFAIDDSKNEYLITITENGYGKKTKINDFYTQGRKGKGVSVYKESGASGKLVSALIAKDEDSILLSGTNNLRISVKDISEQSRLSTGSIVANAHINSIIKI